MSMPTNLLLQMFLVAQSRTQFAGGSTKSELFSVNTQGLIGLGIVAAVATLAVVAVYYLKNRKRLPENDLSHLFRELCDAHQLGRRNRELLSRFAKARRISNPCTLFLDSSLWQSGHVPAAAGTQQYAEQQKLDQLKKTLFSLTKSKSSVG